MNTEELISAAQRKLDAAISAAQADYQRDVDAIRRAAGIAELPADGTPPVRLVAGYRKTGVGRAVRKYLETAPDQFYAADMAAAIGVVVDAVTSNLRAHVNAGRVRVAARGQIGPKGHNANLYEMVRPGSAATA